MSFGAPCGEGIGSLGDPLGSCPEETPDLVLDLHSAGLLEALKVGFRV